MEAPLGFTTNFGINRVCKLKKALYGLKQSPRVWFGRSTSEMKTNGVQTITRKSYTLHQEIKNR